MLFALCFVYDFINQIGPFQCFITVLSTHQYHFLKFQEFRKYTAKRDGTVISFMNRYLPSISSVHNSVLDAVGNMKDNN